MEYPSQTAHTTGPRLPRLESALSVNIGECSIVAAEVNRKAYDIEGQNHAGTNEWLYVFEPDAEEPSLAYFKTVPLTEATTLPDGRPIRYVLGKLHDTKKPKKRDVITPTLQLMGVIRGNLAFPLASFNRRSGSFCDYVQIGSEMTDDSLIVTPADELRSRKEVVDLINTILDVSPVAIKYKTELETIPEAKIDRLTSEIEARSDYMRFVKPTMSKKDAKIAAVLAKGAELGYFKKPGYTRSLIDTNQAGTVRPSHWIRQMNKKISKPDELPVTSIEKGKFPGSEYSVVRQILLRMHLEAQGVSSKGIEASNIAASGLARALDLSGSVDKRLGEYDSTTEKVINFTTRLAASKATRSTVVEDMTMATSSRADTEISARAQAISEMGAYLLRVFVKPVALDRQEAIEAGEHLIRTIQPNNHIKPEDLAELSSVIDIFDR